MGLYSFIYSFDYIHKPLNFSGTFIPWCWCIKMDLIYIEQVAYNRSFCENHKSWKNNFPNDTTKAAYSHCFQENCFPKQKKISERWIWPWPLLYNWLVWKSMKKVSACCWNKYCICVCNWLLYININSKHDQGI